MMVDGEPVELTATEFHLLKTLLENPGYAFTRSELIEQDTAPHAPKFVIFTHFGDLIPTGYGFFVLAFFKEDEVEIEFRYDGIAGCAK